MPTYKERGNVAELVRRLDAALTGIAWEAIFVDDNSPDGTWETVQKDRRRRSARALSAPVWAGAGWRAPASKACPPRPRPFLAVIDADLQHDETVLPKMLATLQGGGADLVAATRYVEGGNAASFSETRGFISNSPQP